MIYLKTNPKGIDVSINGLQKAIAQSVSWVDYNAYHRAYKNVSNGNVIPEVFKVKTAPNVQSKIGEYEEVLLNDNLNANSFFSVADTRQTVDNGNLISTIVSVIFQVDLTNLTGIKESRQDEEIHQIIATAINESGFGKVNSLITGIPTVYAEFDTSKIRFDDLQPFHCFKVDIDVNYEYNCSEESETIVADINGNTVVFI